MAEKPRKIIFGDGATRTFVGLCCFCGEQNGIGFEYPNIPWGPSHNPVCKNRACANYGGEISWIDVEDLERG